MTGRRAPLSLVVLFLINSHIVWSSLPSKDRNVAQRKRKSDVYKILRYRGGSEGTPSRKRQRPQPEREREPLPPRLYRRLVGSTPGRYVVACCLLAKECLMVYMPVPITYVISKIASIGQRTRGPAPPPRVRGQGLNYDQYMSGDPESSRWKGAKTRRPLLSLSDPVPDKYRRTSLAFRIRHRLGGMGLPVDSIEKSDEIEDKNAKSEEIEEEGWSTSKQKTSGRGSFLGTFDANVLPWGRRKRSVGGDDSDFFSSEEEEELLEDAIEEQIQEDIHEDSEIDRDMYEHSEIDGDVYDDVSDSPVEDYVDNEEPLSEIESEDLSEESTENEITHYEPDAVREGPHFSEEVLETLHENSEELFTCADDEIESCTLDASELEEVHKEWEALEARWQEEDKKFSTAAAVEVEDSQETKNRNVTSSTYNDNITKDIGSSSVSKKASSVDVNDYDSDSEATDLLGKLAGASTSADVHTHTDRPKRKKSISKSRKTHSDDFDSFDSIFDQDSDIEDKRRRRRKKSPTAKRRDDR